MARNKVAAGASLDSDEEMERLKKLRTDPWADVSAPNISNHHYRITFILTDDDVRDLDEVRNKKYIVVGHKDGGTRARPMSRTEAARRCFYIGLQASLTKKEG